MSEIGIYVKVMAPKLIADLSNNILAFDQEISSVVATKVTSSSFTSSSVSEKCIVHTTSSSVQEQDGACGTQVIKS